MAKRSPRYPRHNLSKAIDMARKLFAGAHQSEIDVDSAAKIIGYSGSSGGAAASAIGALRQFGLVDGLRGDVAVSDLAMRILEPMNDLERYDAIREAAMRPEIFERLVNQFGGRLPLSDEPIRSFLIRQEGFSASGADDLIETLRETLANLPDGSEVSERSSRVSAENADDVESPREVVPPAPRDAGPASQGELITLPLGQDCKAELRLIGNVTASSYGRLIKHLELLRDIAAEEA